MKAFRVRLCGDCPFMHSGYGINPNRCRLTGAHVGKNQIPPEGCKLRKGKITAELEDK